MILWIDNKPDYSFRKRYPKGPPHMISFPVLPRIATRTCTRIAGLVVFMVKIRIFGLLSGFLRPR